MKKDGINYTIFFRKQLLIFRGKATSLLVQFIIRILKISAGNLKQFNFPIFLYYFCKQFFRYFVKIFWRKLYKYFMYQSTKGRTLGISYQEKLYSSKVL